jgi:hypothetical protein
VFGAHEETLADGVEGGLCGKMKMTEVRKVGLLWAAKDLCLKGT